MVISSQTQSKPTTCLLLTPCYTTLHEKTQPKLLVDRVSDHNWKSIFVFVITYSIRTLKPASSRIFL